MRACGVLGAYRPSEDSLSPTAPSRKWAKRQGTGTAEWGVVLDLATAVLEPMLSVQHLYEPDKTS